MMYVSYGRGRTIFYAQNAKFPFLANSLIRSRFI